MACSPSSSSAFLARFSALLLLTTPVLAKTINLDWNITWVNSNPDGKFIKPTIGVNGQWPLPLIEATKGDRLVLNVNNQLGNQSTSLHFHGMFQNGTNHMDGAVGITQCAIPPGHSFTYDFKFDQVGTYWYHAHNDGQYPEGLRGPVVIHDPNGPYEGKYDEELIITFSDWYHQSTRSLIKELINVENPTGAEPVPNSALMNDTQNLQVKVQPGKTYLIRMVNIGAFASQYIWFEGHEMRVVEVDGVWTEKAKAEMLYITPAQRYSVLLTTKKDASQNFAIVGSMDEELFDVIPDGLNSNVTGWLVYDDKKPLPEPTPVDSFDEFDDFDLVPVDRKELYDKVDYSFSFTVKMDNLGDGANYAFFNDKTYVAPKVPSLFTALTVGEKNAANPLVYGTNTISHVLKHNEVIEIVLNNEDDGKHPFHLHGHQFQVVHRSDEDAGAFSNDSSVGFPKYPMRRDTLVVEGNGNFVIRFKANNPGVWLFHCHIEWHMDQGLVATIIEAPEALQGLRIPEGHLEVCRAGGVPTKGNAAGNTKNVLDLSGENKPVGPLPEGFTPKGYVAMFFSCVAAFLGLAIISWYGVIDSDKKENVEGQSASRDRDD
ncbi:iron transport multicopper oxidase fet3 [Colletotrichum truncatum]|uniref:Iron transport multicopper oxidase fet3 n=1 Tax=Colletotrichum truncatum TaxID=5467 RepID=A0ACC3Z113_COLTU|nr:iron transport multicopper oxidase fet3 [Colletotrichum truncatum]XP_036588810.1 iron transport multicopper oxidase fet3 [Colletotrichum truncatum]KAF6780628.1 iron transport multicopper oxidase fet3 [Colletotrichum truncatum]KAF6800452.1 iron transport multicopper oxidase fet3 [Colletotrichum truncatum]